MKKQAILTHISAESDSSFPAALRSQSAATNSYATEHSAGIKSAASLYHNKNPPLSPNGAKLPYAPDDLEFEVANDRGNVLARRLGIAFTPIDSVPGGDLIGRVTATGSDELPQPAIVVIDRNFAVRFVDVSPDWLRRTEVEPVLDTFLTEAQ